MFVRSAINKRSYDVLNQHISMYVHWWDLHYKSLSLQKICVLFVRCTKPGLMNETNNTCLREACKNSLINSLTNDQSHSLANDQPNCLTNDQPNSLTNDQPNCLSNYHIDRLLYYCQPA